MKKSKKITEEEYIRNLRITALITVLGVVLFYVSWLTDDIYFALLSIIVFILGVTSNMVARLRIIYSLVSNQE